MIRPALFAACLACASPSLAQFPSLPSGTDKVLKGVQAVNDLTVTAEEERQIGAGVSERIRAKYGVVQDPAVHRYVALIGSVITQASEQPALGWQFIVLDTDGVNAFAAPGGFVHVTRGALGLMKSEAELASVLAHEVAHVTGRHTINAMKKGTMSDLGLEAGISRAPGGGLSRTVLDKLADRATEMVLNGFGRAEELESDEDGVALANKVGYAPSALGSFLTHLAERNRDAKEKRGLFASHPQTKERLDRLAKQIQTQKLASTVTLEDRYAKSVAFEAKPQAEIATVEPGAAGLAGGGSSSAAAGTKPEETKAEEQPKKKGMFGLGKKVFGGGEKKSAQVTGSGGARGVDPERDSVGGGNPAVVAVNITPADIDAFKKEGGLV